MNTPDRIGKYLISGVLGRGSMGVVYKGFDPHIHRIVAIKTVHRELLGDVDAQDSAAARFRNEAKAVGRIAHPGVVAIYEFGEDGDTTFIAMEFVEGNNLEDVLAATPMLPDAQLLDIMDQLLAALSVAHAQGVWHRDIKPANLILTSSGQVKLTDFGIARLEDANLTQAASAIGTPAYMAPEQFTGVGIDHRADLFACGGLLYRLLTGRKAFSGGAQVVMYKIMNETPDAPSSASGGARSVAYDAVVARAMSKRAEDRYPNAQALRQALHEIAGEISASGVAADPTVFLPTPEQVRPRYPATAVSRNPVESTGTANMASATMTGSGNTAGGASASGTFGASGTFSGSSTFGAAGTAAVARPSGLSSTTGASLSEEFKAQAQLALARRLGPIARVYVRRAAEQSGGERSRFIQLLLESAGDADRTSLQRDLDVLR